MAGKKMRMEEVALYTVSDGKVTREEFFYDMSGGGETSAEPGAGKKAKKPVTKKKPAKKAAPKAKARPRSKARASSRRR
jgi:hypothetical protein